MFYFKKRNRRKMYKRKRMSGNMSENRIRSTYDVKIWAGKKIGLKEYWLRRDRKGGKQRQHT
jgi:hypothetical protein